MDRNGMDRDGMDRNGGSERERERTVTVWTMHRHADGPGVTMDEVTMELPPPWSKMDRDGARKERERDASKGESEM